MLQPDGVTDNFRRKAKTALDGCLSFHWRSLSNSGQLDNTLSILLQGVIANP